MQPEIQHKNSMIEQRQSLVLAMNTGTSS